MGDAVRQPLGQSLASLKRAVAETAVERDRAGGTAKRERDLIRQSGLLGLAVPPAFGGIGASWPVILNAVRELAQVDSSLAHLFAFQHLMVASVLFYANPAQRESLLTATAAGPLFWGNALNPQDRRTTLTRQGDGWRLNGTKSFCSGATDSNLLLVSADDPDGKVRVLALPTGRDGIAVLNDWDNMGQRQTDSGTVTFTDVEVAPSEILGPPGPFGDTFSSLRSCVAQAILGSIYLGITQGALAGAKDFTLTQSRPWRTSGVASTADDPYILKHYGEFHVALAGVEALAERAFNRLQAAWLEDKALSAASRGEAAITIATFKAAAARTGLDITSRIFEVTGARATASRHGFDRFWRNLRTHTLHDPVDYKLKELGALVLTDTYPEPSFYS